jgi:dienelactone hydrolase
LNRLWAEIIDKYALCQLHKEKSTKRHFSNTGFMPTLEEPNLFYFKPQTPKVGIEYLKNNGNYETGNFKYKSEIENDKCNEYATGIYYESRLPPTLSIVLVHGWRQINLERIKAIYLKPFMGHGYNLYFITLPYHMERQGNNSLYSGEYMISANIDRTLSSIRQAVVDLRALISWLKLNRTGKVVIVGISLGGLVANLTSAVDDNLDGIISVFAPNDLSHTIWNNMPGKYIKQDFKENAFTYDQLKTCWAIINTSNFETMLPKEKMLILSALYDQYIDLKDADKLWEKWGRPERKVYYCGHAGLVLCKKDIAHNSLEFIKRNVLGEVK